MSRIIYSFVSPPVHFPAIVPIFSWPGGFLPTTTLSFPSLSGAGGGVAVSLAFAGLGLGAWLPQTGILTGFAICS